MEKTYSVIINEREMVITVRDNEDHLLVTFPETDQSRPLRLEFEEDGVVLGTLDDHPLRFGHTQSGDDVEIVLGGISYRANVVEKRFREHEKKRAADTGAGSVYEVEASIPGQVIELHVSEGDSVESGQTLLLLSAMKLENEVQAPRSGTVTNIRVDEDQNVTKGDVLVEIEQ